MTTLFADSPISVATWIVIKASILLGVATLVQMAFGRRASAATRHRIWMLGLTSMLVLPVATAMLPQWPLAIHVEPKAADVALAGSALEQTFVDSAAAAPGALPTPEAPSAFSLSPSIAIAGIYLAGVAALLLFLAVATPGFEASCSFLHHRHRRRLDSLGNRMRRGVERGSSCAPPSQPRTECSNGIRHPPAVHRDPGHCRYLGR